MAENTHVGAHGTVVPLCVGPHTLASIIVMGPLCLGHGCVCVCSTLLGVCWVHGCFGSYPQQED